MRRTLTLVAVAVVAIATTVFNTSPALAHGYVNYPPSRQANCAQGKVPDCGNIIYEPQSVEGPKGLRSCNANLAQFAELSDESKPWPATQVGSTVTFTWTFTARHATLNYEYYIGNTRVAVFDGHGQQPPPTISHNVDLSGYSGRQKVLAIWNISDTANAFYSCIDLQIGGGGGNPTPTPTPTVTPTPTPTPTPTTTAPSGTWKAGTAYAAGDVVTYNGATYRCVQAHTALAGWEPPNVPALWQRA
ncbi:cellulose-binding protein [Nonomuraea phyllanthi]|uniref:Cellulose-binding protein n=1 Tax=Nonomuraea phyllanthi TaxID=2219224 RepID=A0A5C4WVK8_9ACTN|nr:lytic polysaccharide monooxygenase [Nonomuraea phyllanthi]KAB8197618.1 cellulose-binding protein [Nonomuraea phyllanthi]QFY06386.1 cellulose-binding protein [Nonomuraea phyllanthi]